MNTTSSRLTSNNNATLPIPMEDLIAKYDDYKYGFSKLESIVRSVLSWISIFSLFILMWMICRSHVGLSSTFHRLMFGMSILHMLYTLTTAHFNVMVPKDMDYTVWNARGNVHTCTMLGFFQYFGINVLLYESSLNIYFMMVVTFNKSDQFIRKRVEPWLLWIPICISFGSASLAIAGDNVNSDNLGYCYVYRYEPPHCIGYEDGQVRDGFQIPCGRGESSGEILQIMLTITATVAPIISLMLLVIIYTSVRRLERKVARDWERGAEDGNDTDELISSIRDRSISLSRAVLNRAFAFAVVYSIPVVLQFVGWVWYTFMPGNRDAEPWHRWLFFMLEIFMGLWGFFLFNIYLYPKVVHAKRSNNLFRAIIVAIQSRGPHSGDMEVDDGATLDAELELAGGMSLQDEFRHDIVSNTEPEVADDMSSAGEIDEIVLDAEVELASDAQQTSLQEQQSMMNEEYSSRQEGTSVQCSIPFAQPVPNDNEREDNEREEETESSNRGGNSEGTGSGIDAAAPHYISPMLRSVLERKGIAIATFHQYHESEDASSEGSNDVDSSEVEKLHQMTEHFSKFGFIPEPDPHGGVSDQSSQRLSGGGDK